MIDTAWDLAFKALCSIVRVALTEEILRVDARDETSVAWHTLIANLMGGSIHPSAASLAHIAAHGYLLWHLVCAIDRG